MAYGRWQTFWTAIGALGTVGTVVVALYFGLRENSPAIQADAATKAAPSEESLLSSDATRNTNTKDVPTGQQPKKETADASAPRAQNGGLSSDVTSKALPSEPIQKTYLINGIHGQWEMNGSFAEVIMPGLAANTTVTLWLRVGWLFPGSSEMEVPFRVNVGSGNRVRFLLPKFIRPVGAEEFVDLSNKTYVFAYETDDLRFSRCGRRVVRMTEGDDDFVFNPPERAFCRPDDTTPNADIEAAMPQR